MTIGFSQDELPSTCGVGVIYDFSINYSRIPEIYEGGAGLFCAGYINTPRCKEVYEEMKKKYKLILRTKPRINENSGNMFSFLVYDRNWEDFTPEMNDKKVWPFEETE